MVQLIDINIFCDEDSLINFNSTMVQLIVASQLYSLLSQVNFNSTMVQLIDFVPSQNIIQRIISILLWFN